MNLRIDVVYATQRRTVTSVMRTSGILMQQRRLYGNVMMRRMKRMETSWQVFVAGDDDVAAGQTTTGKPKKTRTMSREIHTSTNAGEVALYSINCLGATAANEVPRGNFSSPRCAALARINTFSQ